MKAGIAASLVTAPAVSTLRPMDRATAAETLRRLHAAQGDFYASGDAARLERCSPGTSTASAAARPTGVPRSVGGTATRRALRCDASAL